MKTKTFLIFCLISVAVCKSSAQEITFSTLFQYALQNTQLLEHYLVSEGYILTDKSEVQRTTTYAYKNSGGVKLRVVQIYWQTKNKEFFCDIYYYTNNLREYTSWNSNLNNPQMFQLLAGVDTKKGTFALYKLLNPKNYMLGTDRFTCEATHHKTVTKESKGYKYSIKFTNNFFL